MPLPLRGDMSSPVGSAIGGAIYGWVTWRTRSIVWGAAAHVYIVTLVIVAAGGLAAA